MSQSAKILVVGGGFTGISAASALARSLPSVSITLVASHEYFEFIPSVLRCLVRPEHIRRIVSLLNGRTFEFLHASVVSLSTHVAELRLHDQHATESRIQFDYCVWAVGIGYSLPIKTKSSNHFFSEREDELQQTHDEILKANSFLVVGGGLVGVELAAELALGLPREKPPLITLATSARGLLPRLPDRAREYAKTWLQSRHVRLVQERVRPSLPTQQHGEDDGDIALNRDGCDGPLRADVTFWCTGPGSSGASNALVVGGVATPQHIGVCGRVLVRPTLQLPSEPNIFAAGDCALVAGELIRDGHFAEKTAYAAMEAGRLAASNICALVRAEQRSVPVRRLMRFPEHAFPLGVFPRLFCVSLYKDDGILCIGPVVITGYFAAVSKRAIEALSTAALSGSRAWDVIFLFVERTAFLIASLSEIVVSVFQNRTRRNGITR